MYEDKRYAAERLHNTVIRTINGSPVLVEHINFNGDDVCVKYLRSGRRVDIDYHKLNMEPVPLGYVNFKDWSAYATRMPMREDWRQGLRRNNLCYINEDGHIPTEWNDLVIANTIQNKYPSLDDAIMAIENGVKSIAFARAFALVRGSVYYKGAHNIGNIIMGKVDLFDRFKYLDRVLEESLEMNNG